MQVVAPSKKSRKADFRFNILILQVIVVAIILVFAVCIRIFGGEVYEDISVWYRENFNDITTPDEVLEVPEQEADTTGSVTPDANKVTVEDESFEDDLFSETEKTDEIEASVVGYLHENEVSGSKMVSTTGVNSLIWPVSGPVTSEYGYRIHPITGVYSMHGGIDIAAVTGTPIRSVYDGKITATGYSNSYGYYVIITHSDNLQTLYAHCSKIIAKEGDEVKKGDEFALVGNTGRSTGAHLHFEIRIGGCRVDPRWLLSEVTDV